MKDKAKKGYYVDRFKYGVADFHYNKPILSIPIYVGIAASMVLGSV